MVTESHIGTVRTSTIPDLGQRACPTCDAPNSRGNKFCGECGTQLPRSFRCQATVLFTDVCNFTGMSEHLDPEDVYSIMERAFAVITDAVHHHGGSINQFLGDGVMALFGIPTAHEDHPYRAIMASLEIRENLERLRNEVRTTYGIEFRVRSSIHSGPIVVGVIGDELRSDYTAAGDTTGVAAQLLRFATSDQILVSSRTRELTGAAFLFHELGAGEVMGRLEAVSTQQVCYEVIGELALADLEEVWTGAA
jgi:class 3 adenylate cyclase